MRTSSSPPVLRRPKDLKNVDIPKIEINDVENDFALDGLKDSPSVKVRKDSIRSTYSSRQQQWKKLLWLNQNYPDNYTDEEFLSQLKRNTTVVNYSYWKLMNDFSLIVLHLSTIILVILIFYGYYNLNWNPLKPVCISSSVTLISYFIYHVKDNEINSRKLEISNGNHNHYSGHDFLSTLKSTVLLLLILLILSPVFKSLTNSTSSDSIWALSTWLCILNILFNDYSVDLEDSTNQSNNNNSNLSKNLSLSNAIVLASRLNSNLSVFCFVLFSIQINGLFPIFNNFTRKYYHFRKFHYFQFFSINCIVDYLLVFKFGWIKIFLIWFSLKILIMFIMPYYFIFLQKYKDELQGPWDPAKPVIKNVNINI
ncbi:hypothetical protein PACTADRAFT_65547 [Pachysolen tannophilus NRRL Y-2460]|uniref:Phosphatidylinositol N-acetylglucosaminyltransferase n=1 Tax=Pachysolen tannophilus NRRL Y-2460 TaxID=669874 RepID=A0A1E4TYR4_PACTA|nr:hypothetical protein PACTADRAFT_65547 [Pachysolen tannophilus NRRL Y-2460]